MWLLEYGRDNCWTGDGVVENAVHVAITIFRYAFPTVRLSLHSAMLPTTALSLKMH